MNRTIEEKNKALVLKAFDTLFNKRDYVAAEKYWSPHYIQHSAHIAPGRVGLFNLIKEPATHVEVRAGNDHGWGRPRDLAWTIFGLGQSVNWVAADIVLINEDVLVEHWNVIQDEAIREQSKSGQPMFGDNFATQP